MPNRLTPLYSIIYYKEENYLNVRTTVFKYITPPIIKVEYVSTLVYKYVTFLYFYIPTFPHSELLLYIAYVTQLPLIL